MDKLVRAITDEDFETNDLVKKAFKYWRDQFDDVYKNGGVLVPDDEIKEHMKTENLYTGEIDIEKDSLSIFGDVKQKFPNLKEMKRGRLWVPDGCPEFIDEKINKLYGLTLKPEEVFTTIPLGDLYGRVFDHLREYISPTPKSSSKE